MAYRVVADCWERSSLQSVYLELGSQFETAGNCQIYLAGDVFDGVVDFEHTSNQERRQYAGPEPWAGREGNGRMSKRAGQIADFEVSCSFSYYQYQIGRKGCPSQRDVSFFRHFAVNCGVEWIRGC